MANRRITRKNVSATQAPPPSGLVRHTEGSEQQTDLLRLVLGAEEISLNVPEDAKLADLEKTLNMAVRGFRRISEAGERLKPIIGRLLLIAQDRHLFRPDYKNITEYIEKKVEGEMGMSRNSAFEALRIAKAFPSLSMADYQKYGATRLLEALKITSEADPQYRTVLEDSARQTAVQFKGKVKQIIEANVAPSTSFAVTIHLPNEWADSWKGLLLTTSLDPTGLVMELIRSYVQTHQAAPPQSQPQPAAMTH